MSEAFVGSNRSGFGIELLFHKTIDETVTGLSLDVSQIDFNQYKVVWLLIDAGVERSYHQGYEARINGIADSVYYGYSTGGSSYSNSIILATSLTQWTITSNNYFLWTFGPFRHFTIPKSKISEIKTLNFIEDEIPAGTSFTIYGIHG